LFFEPAMIVASALAVLALAAGSAPGEGGPADSRTGGGTEVILAPLPGWERTEHRAHYTPADLHEYLNGGAAKYLAYSLVELHVQEYARSSDGFRAILELYRMNSAANAFGVYSSDRAGAHPEGIGAQAAYAGGLLRFWQGCYYARLQAVEPAADPSGPVLKLGRTVSETLPSWDPAAAPELSSVPPLALRMPTEGLVEDSLCFFHTHNSLNSIYYISEKNVLNLSAETDAVCADYLAPGGERSTVIAVCYPDTESALLARDSMAEAAAGAFLELRERLLVLVPDAAGPDQAARLGRRVLARLLDADACGGAAATTEGRE